MRWLRRRLRWRHRRRRWRYFRWQQSCAPGVVCRLRTGSCCGWWTTHGTRRVCSVAPAVNRSDSRVSSRIEDFSAVETMTSRRRCLHISIRYDTNTIRYKFKYHQIRFRLGLCPTLSALQGAYSTPHTGYSASKGEERKLGNRRGKELNLVSITYPENNKMYKTKKEKLRM